MCGVQGGDEGESGGGGGGEVRRRREEAAGEVERTEADPTAAGDETCGPRLAHGQVTAIYTVLNHRGYTMSRRKDPAQDIRIIFS